MLKPIKIIDPFKLLSRAHYGYTFVFQAFHSVSEINKYEKEKKKAKKKKSHTCVYMFISGFRKKKTAKKNGIDVSITSYMLNICFLGINVIILFTFL